MPYQESKIYFDGSHYIAVPKENFPSRKGRKTTKKPTKQTDTPKERFETAYKESQALPKREQKKYIAEKLQDIFANSGETDAFVADNIERKKTNAAKRRIRLMRKVYLQKWNFFTTFTYDSTKHTEETFKNTLRNTLKHLVNRKGWKYIGVWERSASERLHFHGIFYIPENAMTGELKQVRDYSTKQHRMQTTYQNTRFLQQFGRNDFEELNTKSDIMLSVRYLLKYIEKSGEKLVYGGDLPTYFISDVMDEDIVCPTGIDDRKEVLFDDFNCWDEGCLIGKVSPETISQLRKSN